MLAKPAGRFVLLVVTSFNVSLAVASHSIAGETAGPRAGPGKPGKKELATARQWLRYAAGQAAAVPLDQTEAPSFGPLDWVGEAQIQAGDARGAIATAERILVAAAKAPDRAYADLNRLSAASVLIYADQPARARTLLDRVEADVKPTKVPDPGVVSIHYSLDDWALRQVAVQRVRLGEFDRAHAAAAAIPIHAQRAFALADIAKALFRMDRPAEAEQALAQARAAGEKLDSWAQSHTCALAAEAFLAGDRFDEAWEVAIQAKELDRRVQAMTWVLEGQGAGKKIDASRATAERIAVLLDAEHKDNVEKRVSDYLYLSDSQRNKGQDPAGALETLGRLAPVLKGLPPGWRKRVHLRRAAAYAVAADVAAATRELTAADALAVDAKLEPRLRGDYSMLAEAFARAGEFDTAERLTGRSGDSWGYVHIGTAMAERGRVEDAILTLAELERDTTREIAVRRIAAGWAKRADRKGLNAWITGLPSASQRANAALGAAEGLMGVKVTLEFLDSPPLIMTFQ